MPNNQEDYIPPIPMPTPSMPLTIYYANTFESKSALDYLKDKHIFPFLAWNANQLIDNIRQKTPSTSAPEAQKILRSILGLSPDASYPFIFAGNKYVGADIRVFARRLT